jgi:hypothetical protein
MEVGWFISQLKGKVHVRMPYEMGDGLPRPGEDGGGDGKLSHLRR